MGMSGSFSEAPEHPLSQVGQLCQVGQLSQGVFVLVLSELLTSPGCCFSPRLGGR